MSSSLNKDDKKGIFEKLLKGRIREKAIFSEFQEERIPPHVESLFESALELSILGSLLIIIFQHLHLSRKELLITFSIISFGYLIWKGAKVAHLGWNRLIRLHEVIEEERHEIEHRRENERKELETLYSAKGFSGELLQEVVNTLMSDDNRLLQIMLEEEMGLHLESYEHPLKRGVFASLGTLLSYVLSIIFVVFLTTTLATLLPPLLWALGSTFISYRFEKLEFSSSLIWLFAIVFFTLIASYFLIDLLS